MTDIRKEIFEALVKRREEPDLKALDYVLITKDVDSDVASTFEGTLENDASDFFFGGEFTATTEQEDDEVRKGASLPTGSRKPIYTYEGKIDENFFKIKVYRSSKLKCARCLQYKVEKKGKIKSVIDRICPECLGMVHPDILE